MKNIKQTYLIAAPVADVWQALTDPKLIQTWSGADAEFAPEVGFEYSLWDGGFCGKILEVAPQKKLVQSWEPDYWEIEDSVVTFTLAPMGNQTQVDLFHKNVEPSDYEETKEGWNLYYLGAIKQMLEERAAKSVKKTKTAKKTASEKSPRKKTRKTKARR